MTKKKVKSLAIVLSLVVVVGAAVCAGCAPGRQEAGSEGSFYSLEEAYEGELLTQDDLRNTAYWYHTRYGETEHVDASFEPSPKTPETLSEDTQDKLKRTYLDEVIKMPDGSPDEVVIRGYFGTYNGCVVVDISDNYHQYDYVFEPEHEIGGVTFYDYVSAFLRVWAENG